MILTLYAFLLGWAGVGLAGYGLLTRTPEIQFAIAGAMMLGIALASTAVLAALIIRQETNR